MKPPLDTTPLSLRAKIGRTMSHVLMILIALGAILYLLVIPSFFVHTLTKRRFNYPDPNQGKTPKSYGLEFEWVEFHSPEHIPLGGWFIPAEGQVRGTIIYCHGLNRARVEMLPEAVWGHQLGYDGLLFDFRHAGQSGGEATPLGYQERLGVLAAARNTLAHHLRLFLHLPGFPLADEVAYGIGWRGRFWPSQFDLGEAAARIGSRPILFVAVEGDRRMPPSIARELYARAVSPQKKLVVLPGKRHGEGFNQATKQYEQVVREFLADIPPARP